MDPEFFSWLELQQHSILEQEPAILAELIGHCCRLKAQVVGADERERTGRRAILNYGHTFGHALETVMGYGTWLHGEAVARGMSLAMATANRLQMVDALAADRQIRLLQDFGLPAADLNEPRDPQARTEWATQMIQAMSRDKKNQGRGVELILPTKIGRVESVLWPGDEIIRSILEEIP
jgi:3-dehydroquinate synthase